MAILAGVIVIIIEHHCTLRLHSPPVLLGYERTGSAFNTFATEDELAATSQSKNATFLNIYATLQPALMVPDPIKVKLDCNESMELAQHCESWSKDFASIFPHRRVNPMVADVKGKSSLMTRYFASFKPPDELMDSSEPLVLAEKVAWYVSLIPYLPSNVLFPGLEGIWPTSDQFLRMMGGSEIEHAVLLTNVFSGMGKKAFLIFGKGAPEGSTAYVLSIEENGDHWMWNAVTGEHFSTKDTFCPLEAVYAVANEGNIWANIQHGEAPLRIRWTFSSSSDWKPLFGKNFGFQDLPSVQPGELEFSKSDSKTAKHLKDRLERTLRDSLMNMRRKTLMRTTTMNFQGNAVLRKLLPGLERARGGRSTDHRVANTAQLSELQRIASSYKVCGFPLHLPFADVDSLVEAVASTGVHLNKEPGVEFSLAVHVEAYPNLVMSVWVYVASLVRRR